MITYDRHTNLGTTWTAASATFEVELSASLKGLVIIVVDNASSSTITGVTYGGDALSQISGSPQNQTSGETSGLSMWFLGTGLATGVQDVVVTSSSSSTTKCGSIVSFTAARDTVVNAVQSVANSSSAEHPSATLTNGSVVSYVVMGFHSGQDAVTGIAPRDAGWTSRRELDLGTQTYGCYTTLGYAVVDEVPVGLGSLTVGWSQTPANDANGIAVAIAEASPLNYVFTNYPEGQFTCAAQSATLSRTRVVKAAVASIAKTGQNLTSLFVSRKITASSTGITLSGKNLTSLLVSRSITASPATITTSANDLSSLLVSRVLTAGVAAIVATPIDAVLARMLTLTASSTSVTLTTWPAEMTYTPVVIPPDVEIPTVERTNQAGGGYARGRYDRSRVGGFNIQRDDEEIMLIVESFLETQNELVA